MSHSVTSRLFWLVEFQDWEELSIQYTFNTTESAAGQEQSFGLPVQTGNGGYDGDIWHLFRQNDEIFA